MRSTATKLLVGVIVASAALLNQPVASHADPAISGYPNSIAALGGSFTQAHASCPPSGGDCPANSWSTGTNPAVNSQYLRILSGNPAISGNNYNDAHSGAKMSALGDQITTAIGQHADYVTILMGFNDVCTSSELTMTSVSTFASEFQAAMDALSAGLPDSRIFVSSLPDIYHLWSILYTDPTATAAWSDYSICQSMLANPTSMAQADVDRRASVDQRRIDFNTQLAAICAEFIHCRFDDDAAADEAFSASDISSIDYFHPSAAGQQLMASVSWNATFDFTDTTAPVSTATITPSPGGESVTLSATDNVGVSGIEYRIDGGSWQRYSIPVFLASGSTMIFRSVDVNGNIGASKTVSMPASVGGVAEMPDVSALRAVRRASSDHAGTYVVGGSILVAIAALGAAGWYVRRKRAS